MISRILYKIVKFGKSSVKIGGKKIDVLVADSFAKQLVGLMYRKGLKENEGMLFVFGKDARWGIWMANMKFSIDIIWIDSNKKVVGIKRNAKPCASMFSCPAYNPESSSRYVLELPSGGAARHRISKGTRIAFR